MPAQEKTECRSTAPAGEPAASAMPAATAAPIVQPITEPTTAIVIASTANTSPRCVGLAPSQVSRRIAAWFRRLPLAAASRAKASRSAAASPPISSSRRPATVLESLAAWTASTGASSAKNSDADWSWDWARVTRDWKLPTFQACTSPRCSGTIQPYER